ncbi:hypothetical protein [Escherichia coli]|uniref:hypothetical protein n=1 Tax=Escherichia coli TaxID=562 RepID=UPI00201062BC|nr:hypothetical protein [Escherichia coli]
MKITKQKVQSVADLKAGYTLGHADVAMLKAMARQLLSGLEQKPVATFYKSECGNVFNTLDGWLPVEGVNNLYAAPQLPQQAVPDEMPEPDTERMFFTDAVVAIAKVQGWNACRAVMLKSFGNSEQLDEVGSWNNHRNTPTAQACTNPAITYGWVMVPVEPTMEMLDEFDSIIDYGAEDSKDAWSRLIAAAPKQEVNRG